MIHDISFSSCPTTKWVNGRKIGVYSSFNDSRGTAAATAEGSPGEGHHILEVAVGPEEGHRTVAEVVRHIVVEVVLHIAIEVAAGEVHHIPEVAIEGEHHIPEEAAEEVLHTAVEVAAGEVLRTAIEEGLHTIAGEVLHIIAAA